MIVPSMTHAEVFRELEQDRENLERWWMRQHIQNRRKALKMRTFPATWWLEYNSPRHNRYMLCVTVINKKYENLHSVTTYALRKMEKGYTVYMSGIEKHSVVKKSVFVQHVFDRFAERCHVEKTGVELIKHMFEQQVGGKIIDNQRLAGRSVRYNGRDHRFIAINDGVLLGDYEENYLLLRTFITYDKATGLQKEVFEDARSGLPDLVDEIKMSLTYRDMYINNMTANTNLKKPRDIPYGWEYP